MANLSNFIKSLRDVMRNDAGVNGDAQRIEQIAWALFLKVYDLQESQWEFSDESFHSIIPEELRWRNWARRGDLTGESLLSFVNERLFKELKGLKERDLSQALPSQRILRDVFQDANNYMKDGVLLRQTVDIIDKLDLEDYEESHQFGLIYETFLRELQSAGSSGEFYTPRPVTDFMAMQVAPKIGERCADFACGTGGFLASWLNQLKAQANAEDEVSEWENSIYGIEKKQLPYMLCVTNMLLREADVSQICLDNALSKNLLDYTDDDAFDVILMNPPYGGNEKDEIKNHFPPDFRSSETADLFMAVILHRLKGNGRAAVVLPDGFLFGTDNAKLAIKEKLLKEFNLHTIIRLPNSVFAPYTSITTNLLFFDRTVPTERTWFYRLDMPEGYKHFSKTKPILLEHFDPVLEWWTNRREIEVDGAFKSKAFDVVELREREYNLDQCGFPHEEEEILPPRELIMEYQEKRASYNAEIDRILAKIESLL